MSLGARATKGGAKAGSKDAKPQDKGKGTEKIPPKEKVKPQATTEQLRMAHMIDRKSDDASDVRRMVLDLMEMTCRTEEEVCSALHDADNNMEVACDLLLEESTRIQGEWQTSEKKKKKPPASVSNGEVEPPPREPRPRSGARPRRGEGEGAGRGRGGRGGRGARGGRGMRRGAPRGRQHNDEPRERTGGNMGDSFPTTEDWDNEEWAGSLSDTKVLVFTPSASAQNSGTESEQITTQANNSVEDWDTPTETNNGPTDHLRYTYHNTNQPQIPAVSPLGLVPSSVPSAVPTNPEPVQETYQPHQPMGMSGTLSAAQTQYLSQLTQQSQRHENSVYTTNYGVYGSSDITSQRKPQRARVPPPSKIPSTAVEMPGGPEPGGGTFLDVQFGALEPDALREPLPQQKQVTTQPETQPVSSHETPTSETNSFTNTSSMLSETLSVADTTPSSQPIATEAPVTNSTSTLEKQVTSSMKQLSVSAASPAHPAQQSTHRPKQTVGQQNVYATHHAVSHHPPVYGANVYAPQQVNSTNSASLTGQPAMTPAYPSSVTLSQYQPMINSYQQTSSSAGVYGGAALYTAAPYASYQPPHAKLTKDTPQYDSSVASTNSLTNTSTTQSSTAKVTTTTVSSATSNAAYAVQPSPAALYGQQGAAYTYDEQCIRQTMPHHMGGYYEVGYGVGGAREGTFGLTGGERFGRTDAASPQQVPAALPPGYAYFYQPPPTTYQYGVYPYGGGSNVGGVGGVGAAAKVSTYTQQQPAYDAQDTYKAGGPYNASANKTATGGASGPDLTNAMYAKVALNKVNQSYDKAAFHSGTPPPFGAGSHHLYIPAPHHHHHHQLPPHQEGAGGNAGRAAQPKPAAKPAYSQSYWPPN